MNRALLATLLLILIIRPAMADTYLHAAQPIGDVIVSPLEVVECAANQYVVGFAVGRASEPSPLHDLAIYCAQAPVGSTTSKWDVNGMKLTSLLGHNFSSQAPSSDICEVGRFVVGFDAVLLPQSAMNSGPIGDVRAVCRDPLNRSVENFSPNTAAPYPLIANARQFRWSSLNIPQSCATGEAAIGIYFHNSNNYVTAFGLLCETYVTARNRSSNFQQPTQCLSNDPMKCLPKGR